MKLNFWQVLGVILLIGGAGWMLYRENRPKANPAVPTNPPAATTQAK
jgi:hypothetical protein